jgi:hypothetical protein
MAGDIVDTPTDPFIDISSGHAEVRAALDSEGDVDALRLDVSTYDSFAAGAWKANGESLKLRVLDATGQDISDTVVDSSGVISLVGSATGAYSLAVSSDTNEVADYIVRVKAWTEGGWTTLPETDDADGSKDPSGGDPSGGDPEVGIPDGSGTDMERSDGGKPDEDFDIRIVLRDGVYYYEDDVRRASDDSSSGSDPELGIPEGSGPDRQSPGEDVDIKPIICDGVFVIGEGNRPSGDSSSGEDLGDGELTFQPVEGSSPRSMHNGVSPADVDGDSNLTPLDALVLINLLNTRGGGSMTSFATWAGSPGMQSSSTAFPDTNDDGFIGPLDVLFVINQLNSQGVGNPSGSSVVDEEGEAVVKDAAFAAMIDWSLVSGEDDDETVGLLFELSPA